MKCRKCGYTNDFLDKFPSCAEKEAVEKGGATQMQAAYRYNANACCGKELGIEHGRGPIESSRIEHMISNMKNASAAGDTDAVTAFRLWFSVNRIELEFSECGVTYRWR